MKPFLLYHWSPVERRASILKHGLVPGKRQVQNTWRAKHLCFSKFPSVAWALSANMSAISGEWDLWQVWSGHVGRIKTLKSFDKERWHMTEYRTFVRIPKSKLWHVGTRTHTCRRPKPRAK